MIPYKGLGLYFHYDSPWSNARMTVIKCWVENVLQRTDCPILENNLNICLLLVVSCPFLLVVGNFRSLQVVSYSLWVVLGRFLLVVGCSRSFLDRFKSFQNVVGHFRSFLTCCRSFQNVVGHFRSFRVLVSAVFHLDKWSFELIRYSEHITDFLASVKVQLTYIYRWLAKFSSSSFYSACGDKGLKQTRIIFSKKCPCIFSTWPNWRKEFFFGRGRQEWCKVRLPQIALSFNETRFLLLWNLNNPTSCFAVF